MKPRAIDTASLIADLRLAISFLGPFAEPVLENYINAQTWPDALKTELIGFLKQILLGANPPTWLTSRATPTINWQQWLAWIKAALPYLGIFAGPILTGVINGNPNLSAEQKAVLIGLLQQLLSGSVPTLPAPVAA